MSNTNVTLNDALAGYVVRPAGRGPFPGIVVLMEAFGITGHIQGVCERLAHAGYVALAPDIYHGEIFDYGNMEPVLAKIKSVDDITVMHEIEVSLDWLASQPEVAGDRLGIIGFCMGGRLAYLANCRHAARIKAAVAFYGGGIAPDGVDRFGRTPPVGETAAMQHPIFIGYGAEDTSIPAPEHGRVAQALSAHKKRYTLAVYPEAGHGFLCEERASYAAAAAAGAWQETLGFLDSNLG